MIWLLLIMTLAIVGHALFNALKDPENFWGHFWGSSLVVIYVFLCGVVSNYIQYDLLGNYTGHNPEDEELHLGNYISFALFGFLWLAHKKYGEFEAHRKRLAEIRREKERAS